jgi:hypothetical protein
MAHYELARHPRHTRRSSGPASFGRQLPAVNGQTISSRLISRTGAAIDHVAGRNAESILSLQQTMGNTFVNRRLAQPGQAATAFVSPVQRFGAKEHREIGEQAANLKYIKLGTKGYVISYGEMIALAGDIFPDLAYMEKLADNPGKGPDTQEALDYARYIKIGRDDVNGGLPGTEKRYDKSTYSKETVKQVDEMYLNLAAGNATHFVSPHEKGSGSEGPVQSPSAGASYRDYHEIALLRAQLAGKQGESDDGALAAESVGGHFLTDAVSSGHLRTPRLDIIEHWNKDNPHLVERFTDYMAFRVTEWIVNNKWYGKTVRPRYSFQSALDSINAAIASKPPLTMGVLVAIGIHDYDNEHGLRVRSEGQAKTVYGDGNLHKGDTEEIAVKAVKAGIDDVKQAYQLGKDGKTFDEIKAILLGGKTQYVAESILPRLDLLAMRQPMPKWKVGTFEELLDKGPMEEALALAVKNNVSEIKDVAATQKEPGKTAILEGFVKLVVADPIKELKEIYYNDGAKTEQFLSKFDMPKGL